MCVSCIIASRGRAVVAREAQIWAHWLVTSSDILAHNGERSFDLIPWELETGSVTT